MKILFWTTLGCGVLAIALTGCLAGMFYSGDGRLIDHGPTAFDQRYVLDLGSVDLRKTGKVQYHLGKLPNVPFNVGRTSPRTMLHPKLRKAGCKQVAERLERDDA
jgi:hypothetical protein